MKRVKMALWAAAYGATIWGMFQAIHIENIFIAVPVVAALVYVAWFILGKVREITDGA